jgi:hypothetical protein
VTKLIAIDPGELTGFVVVDTETAEVYFSGELSEFETCELVESLLEEDPETSIVMEKFTINATTHKKSAQPTALYLIGAVRYLYRKSTGRILVLQTPADAKSFSTNDKLKAVGFWHKGGEGHANDAFRHALVYMVRTNKDFGGRLLHEVETN